MGGGRDAGVPGGGWLRGAGPAERGLTRPSPVHLLSPSPACPELTLVSSFSLPRRRRLLLLSSTGPPVPLALPAAGLAEPAGPGQAAVSSPPCWLLAHPTGGLTAPQPPVGPAPALTRVGGGGCERRSWCGRAPAKRIVLGWDLQERGGIVEWQGLT